MNISLAICDLDEQFHNDRPSKVTAEMAAFMEAELEKNDESTSAELELSLQGNSAFSFHIPTIKKYLCLVLKWTVVRTRFGPVISDRNKVKRIELAKMCLNTID